MSDPIIIPKNPLDEIRVGWREFKGHRYLDVRLYTHIEGKPDKQPTKRGITLAPHLVAELRQALATMEKGCG